MADEAGSGCFRKRHTEFYMGGSPGQDFIEIFRSLNKMRLAKDDVNAIENIHPYRFEVHSKFTPC